MNFHKGQSEAVITEGLFIHKEAIMLRLGGAAHAPYIEVFRGLQTYFRRQGLDMEWVLYSDYDALVEAFVRREVDIAWNGECRGRRRP